MIEAHNFEPRDAGFGWMINHLPTIVWQRRYYAFTIFVAFLIVACAAAFVLPTLYRSSATLLIESQELPTNVAESPGTGAIEQRIAKIRERVLSRGDLISLIEQYDLYSSERRSQPLSKVIDKMRKATTVGALEGDIGQQPASTPGQSNVIALNMTFDYQDPVKAQEVLQSFVQSFLRMDSDVVEDQAMLTVRFLEDQAQKLASQIQQIESEITALKARNGTALTQGGMPSMIDTGSYSAQIVDLENQNRQLLVQSRNGGGKNQALAAAEAALAAARTQFSDTHPDVIAARQRLQLLRQQAAQAGASSGDDAIQDQIRANNEAIGLLRAQRDSALARANASIAGQSRAPAILEQASQLEDRASQLREQYKKVSDDLLKAQNSARMAGEQRAERLSLVEPANLPDHPHWPNRPLLVGAGAAAGVVFGLLIALLMELLKRPVRSPVQIEGLGIPVVGIVPIIDRRLKKRRWWHFFRRQEAELA
jgi:succinoglycan biosynthesis transport protein ExoP